jgi:riboflavin kinase/FMN adenylyltransferase
VTATRIRDSLAQGELAEANRLLGRPHHLKGEVTRGRGVGHGLGFPTANLQVIDGVMIPADGVYAGRAYLEDADGERAATGYPAAIAVGVPMTFADTSPSLEANLLDYSGELYGKQLTLEFLEYLRPMQAFDSEDALHNAIASDVKSTRKWCE